MRCKALILMFLFCFAQICSAADETIHGFVVGTAAPNTVTLDDFSVTRENRISLKIDSITSGSSRKSLNPGDVRIGDEIEINGDIKPATNQMTVKSVNILSNDSRRFDSAAFSDKPPELQKTPTGWNGYIFVEGMRIHITDSTAVTYHKKKTVLQDPNSKNQVVITPKTSALTSLEGIGPETMVHFQGASQSDGSVLASKVEFEDFELRPGESKLLQKLTPRTRKGDALISQLDELRVGRNAYKLVAQHHAQDYLQKLGESLIPIHQRDLPNDSPLKISYRFFLAQDKNLDIVSFPNGVIVVKSGLFNGLENEAQLAFHLSRAIAVVEEMDTWRITRDARSKKRILATAATSSAMVFGGTMLGGVMYALTRSDLADLLSNQQDRLALEWMLAGGYDIREAPRSYKVYALMHPDHTQLSPKPDPVQTEKNNASAARRSFLMAELRTNYPRTDYSSLKKDSELFQSVVGQKHQLGGR